ncbi:MAG: DUF72 domain-containing protein [Ardenticatenaceae bacterium]|nr:DUF72 domain-containing protein [Ardenticatenaceae bacterium]MCB9445153.1 DUF72 domain-containing protein [Ardenticatenaceae bacterium]
MNNWYLGTMGFGYKEWVGAFYPAGMQSRSFLAHYSQFFNAVEIDTTFYGIPSVAQVMRWTAVTPPDFAFCVKTPRHITHELRLVNAMEPMQEFLEVVSLLEEKLHVVLIQFPPDFDYANFNNVRTFLKELPLDYRFAIEFRHRSWDTPGTAVLLADHDIAWVSADNIHMPRQVRQTTDAIYLRFIGPHGQFATKDKELVDKTAVLQTWYQHLQPHLDEVDAVYGFFNNDYSGFSPKTCNRFKEIVGVGGDEIRPLQQGRLF